MPMPMTGNIDRVEVITSVQRRRRWSAEEKARIVQETYALGMSVSLVARQHGVAPPAGPRVAWCSLEAPPLRPPEILKRQVVAVAAAVGMWATRQGMSKRSVISTASAPSAPPA